MSEDRFWEIIQQACRSDRYSADEWGGDLVVELTNCEADEIIAWDALFDRFTDEAFTSDLAAACYLMNAGAGDDGFYYFRCWLVGMGKRIYMNAIGDADSLVEVALPLSSGVDAEAEIYAAAWRAWVQVTGASDDAAYPGRREAARHRGEVWDITNEEQRKRRLPRLSAFYDE